jgi:hypothetical protein
MPKLKTNKAQIIWIFIALEITLANPLFLLTPFALNEKKSMGISTELPALREIRKLRS